MAISAPVYSGEYVNFNAGTKVAGYDWGGRVKFSRCTLTFTAAGTTTAAAGDIKLIKLPPGKLILLSDLSWIICPVGTATADLDIGWAAYTLNGAAVAASNNGLADSLDVGGGAIDQAIPLPANGEKVFESDNGVDIVCSFDTANSPAAGDLKMRLVYVQL